MKKLILSILLLPTFILSDSYLQDGLYPECSYVIVDQEGWKIHMNQDGKVISMTPKSKHNEKMGKYSFDKFGNLVPYRECDKSTYKSSKNTTTDSKVDIEIEIDLFSNLDFSVFAGMSTPFGDNIDMYDAAPQFGIETKLGNLIFGLGFNSFESEQEITGQNDVVFYRKNTLSSTDISISYKLSIGKLYLTPGLGIFNRSFEATGAGLNSQSLSGADLGILGHVGYDLNKFSVYAGGIYTTTLYELDQTSTFFNVGLKYNF